VELELVFRALIAVSTLISIGSAVVVYMNSPGRKVAAKLTALTAAIETQKDESRASLKGHDRRIQAVEDEMKHLPTSDEFAELQISVTRLDGKIERVDEMVTWVKSTVQSMDNYLRAK
jgi:hypothetical protein